LPLSRRNLLDADGDFHTQRLSLPKPQRHRDSEIILYNQTSASLSLCGP
jgi:hypothetical protein